MRLHCSLHERQADARASAGALLLRPGVVRNPLHPTPDIVEADLERLTDRIIELETT